MLNLVSIDSDRLISHLRCSDKIGGSIAGGLARLALSRDDGAIRDMFCSWGRSRGYAVRVDAIGNIALRRRGARRDQRPVAAGSHLDSQPDGGRFDGVFGVLAALEVLMRADDLGVETSAPLEVICWTNEEGARFGPSMMGSSVFSGHLSKEAALGARDSSGISVAQALSDIGYAGSVDPGYELDSYIEAHIEQGPILERRSTQIGVVTGAQGQLSYNAVVQGVSGHSGTTPMIGRKDAVVAMGIIVSEINSLPSRFGENLLATVGDVKVLPGSRNTIANRVDLTIDIRHPDTKLLSMVGSWIENTLATVVDRVGCTLALQKIMAKPPEEFDHEVFGLIESAADAFGYSHMRMISGAGHDACYVSRVAPTAMIFVPCKGGISHNPAEFASDDQLIAGANVLATAMLARAGIEP